MRTINLKLFWYCDVKHRNFPAMLLCATVFLAEFHILFLSSSCEARATTRRIPRSLWGEEFWSFQAQENSHRGKEPPSFERKWVHIFPKHHSCLFHFQLNFKEQGLVKPMSWCIRNKVNLLFTSLQQSKKNIALRHFLAWKFSTRIC